VIELSGSLDVWTTDETRPFDSEQVCQLRDLLRSPNRQQVRALSSNLTRSNCLPIVDIMVNRYGQLRRFTVCVDGAGKHSIRQRNVLIGLI
jgi:hypothetical protein